MNLHFIKIVSNTVPVLVPLPLLFLFPVFPVLLTGNCRTTAPAHRHRRDLESITGNLANFRY